MLNVEVCRIIKIILTHFLFYINKTKIQTLLFREILSFSFFRLYFWPLSEYRLCRTVATKLPDIEGSFNTALFPCEGMWALNKHTADPLLHHLRELIS